MNTVWLTRSQPGASELAGLLSARGYRTLVWPVLEIEVFNTPRVLVDGKAATVSEAVTEKPRLIIALSGHAVEAFVRASLHEIAGAAVYLAVGSATADRLEQEGIRACFPTHAASEGLLEMTAVQELFPGETVWLLSGEGGRNVLLRHLLNEKHVRVVKWQFYRRVENVKTPALEARQVGAVVIGSHQGLDAFVRLWMRMAGHFGVPLVVPSARVGEGAQAVGFTNVHITDGAGGKAVLAALDDISPQLWAGEE